MAAITICSDFGAPQNKVWHCFHYIPIYFPWSDGTRCHNLSFLVLTKSWQVSISKVYYFMRDSVYKKQRMKPIEAYLDDQNQNIFSRYKETRNRLSMNYIQSLIFIFCFVWLLADMGLIKSKILNLLLIFLKAIQYSLVQICPKHWSPSFTHISQLFFLVFSYYEHI